MRALFCTAALAAAALGPGDALAGGGEVHVLIETQAPKRSTKWVESKVTVPLQNAVVGLADVDETRAMAAPGESRIEIRFSHPDQDRAVQAVRQAIAPVVKTLDARASVTQVSAISPPKLFPPPSSPLH